MNIAYAYLAYNKIWRLSCSSFDKHVAILYSLFNKCIFIIPAIKRMSHGIIK